MGGGPGGLGGGQGGGPGGLGVFTVALRWILTPFLHRRDCLPWPLILRVHGFIIRQRQPRGINGEPDILPLGGQVGK